MIGGLRGRNVMVEGCGRVKLLSSRKPKAGGWEEKGAKDKI